MLPLLGSVDSWARFPGFCTPACRANAKRRSNEFFRNHGRCCKLRCNCQFAAGRGCASMEYYGARSSSQFLPRALFVLLLCVSLTVAAVPVLLFIDRPSWLLWVFAGSLLTGILFLAVPGTRQARPLTNLEKFLAVIAALFTTSAVAFMRSVAIHPRQESCLGAWSGQYLGANTLVYRRWHCLLLSAGWFGDHSANPARSHCFPRLA